MDLSESKWGDMHLIPLAQCSDQCKARVNTIMIWFHKLLGNSRVAEQLATFLEELSSSAN
jgi:hypothetical protein